jgi:hypothetical protein
MDELDSNVQIEVVAAVKEIVRPIVEVPKRTIPLVLTNDQIDELREAYDLMGNAYHRLQDCEEVSKVSQLKVTYFMALQEYKRVHHKHLPGHAIYNFRTGRLI